MTEAMAWDIGHLRIAPSAVCGRQVDAGSVQLWARAEGGHLAMDASATLY